MSEALQYDPATKQRIKDAIFDSLYGPVHASFDAALRKIVQRNTAISKSTHNSMYYRGKIYNFESTPPPAQFINECHPSLRKEMDEHLNEVKRLNDFEIPYVVGFITRVLNSTHSLQDYLRIFPESVHEAILNLALECPCKNPHLPNDDIIDIQKKFQPSIELMKERMVRNLII